MQPGNDLKLRVDFFADWDYNIKLAGVSFRQKELDKLYGENWNKVDIEVVPEPENKFDKNAVAVYANDVHVGYIPALVAPHIKSLIDQEQKFECALIYITEKYNEGKYRGAKIALRKK